MEQFTGTGHTQALAALAIIIVIGCVSLASALQRRLRLAMARVPVKR